MIRLRDITPKGYWPRIALIASSSVCDQRAFETSADAEAMARVGWTQRCCGMSICALTRSFVASELTYMRI